MCKSTPVFREGLSCQLQTLFPTWPSREQDVSAAHNSRKNVQVSGQRETGRVIFISSPGINPPTVHFQASITSHQRQGFGNRGRSEQRGLRSINLLRVGWKQSRTTFHLHKSKPWYPLKQQKPKKNLPTHACTVHLIKNHHNQLCSLLGLSGGVRYQDRKHSTQKSCENNLKTNIENTRNPAPLCPRMTTSWTANFARFVPFIPALNDSWSVDYVNSCK